MWKVNLFLILAIAGLNSCSPDLSDDAIPRDTFSSVTINLNLPEYLSLHTDGGWKYYDDVGVRGVIIYRLDVSTYLAFERNCSYHPNDACATVNVHSSNLYMFDTCCNSTFDFDGTPTGGPAWRPLLQYETLLTGTDLTITDNVVN
jgi:hypothetical protein